MYRRATVRENVLYSARQRLPRDWPDADVRAFAEAVLATLGIDAVADSVVGDAYARGVSGGERKRANIGMELAAAPIFLAVVRAPLCRRRCCCCCR